MKNGTQIIFQDTTFEVERKMSFEDLLKFEKDYGKKIIDVYELIYDKDESINLRSYRKEYVNKYSFQKLVRKKKLEKLNNYES